MKEEMTLKQAIEILTLYDTDYTIRITSAFADAVKLLIEAGKIIERCRNDEDINLDDPLPGETKGE